MTSSPISKPARQKFSVYEMKDGKPDLVNYDLREGTYIIHKRSLLNIRAVCRI